MRAPRLDYTRFIDFIKPKESEYYLLDFFAIGCINCQNNIDILHHISDQINNIEVIGVSVGKFDYEKSEKALKSYKNRYNITYPLYNDFDHKLSDAYVQKAWPYLVLVDSNGYIKEDFVGEFDYTKFITIFSKYTNFNINKSINQTHLYLNKINIYSENIYLSYSNKIDIYDLEFNLIDTIYSLNNPKSVCLLDDILYIALKDSVIYIKDNVSYCLIDSIRNASDIVCFNKLLYISLEGSHEIIVINPINKCVINRYGNKFEALRDGKLENAQFAQPSALSIFDQEIFVIDSESSSLRSISGDDVKTLIGKCLFTFGDSNIDELLLQHPSDICIGKVGDGCGAGRIFICDTYNHKIKVYDIESKTILTLIDEIFEPLSIDKMGCNLYIINSNEVFKYNLSKMKLEKLDIIKN